jgi:hypothetical protein
MINILNWIAESWWHLFIWAVFALPLLIFLMLAIETITVNIVAMIKASK